MYTGITVTEIFGAAGLWTCGPVDWKEPIRESGPGVYVVAICPCADDVCPSVDVSYLQTDTAARWVPFQAIIYIGRTKRPLSGRIGQFYRHVHGDRSPHRGGQDVILLQCPRWVYWSPTEEWANAEKKMIEYFKTKVGQFPFANRIRSARVREQKQI